MQNPTVVRGGLRLLPPPRQSGLCARAEGSQHVGPRHSFGLFALRRAPTPSLLVSLLPIALLCAVFGYFAFVCLTGWSAVSWH